MHAILSVGEISAIRFWHVVTGLDVFTKFGGRYQQVLNGMRREHKTRWGAPFILDMLEWVNLDFLQNDLSNTERERERESRIIYSIGDGILLSNADRRAGEVEDV